MTVLARIEATYKSLDTRYVVTNIGRGGLQWLYDSLYCARGQAENLIKWHKSQLASDRTSCRSPLANQMRLILHTAVYWLMLEIRTAITRPQPLASNEVATIRLRLLKTAGFSGGCSAAFHCLKHQAIRRLLNTRDVFLMSFTNVSGDGQHELAAVG